MDTLESSRRVLHRGRVQDDKLEEQAESAGAIPERPASAEERQQMIAEAAYFLSQGRNFEPAQELEDWLAAEAQIDNRLRAAG